MTFPIKQNDTSPAIVYDLSNDDGPVNLTNATVRFYMGGHVMGAATVINAETGRVAYEWQAGDTARAGFFRAEWEAIFADGTKETFPNDDYIGVNITPDLGEPA